MTEATRGWLYRLAVLAIVAYVVATRPDTLSEILPVLLGLLTGGLASMNTSVRR